MEKNYEKMIKRAHKLNKDFALDMDSGMLGCCLHSAHQKGLFDVDKLNEFNDSNFLHDMCGLVRHWDFSDNSFSNTFLPRSS